jgi:intein/homing endonuclease
VPIEQIRVGDTVLSYDRKKREVVEGRVERTFEFTDKAHGVLFLEDGTQLRVTPDHPIYSATRKAWVFADQLDAGERVRKLRDDLKMVEVRVRSFVKANDTTTVYNFRVTDHHVYFAESVLVHNR